MNYKLLLVDDEEEVRNAIAQNLDWNALGFRLAGQASNGEEALEMLETLQPDVLLTDIKMPFMGGLELCRQAKKLLPGIHLAIFSGFDEFEYAREAIRLDVEEYILKPIDAKKLTEVLRRLHTRLDEEIEEHSDAQRLRQYYEESLPFMRQQLLLSWMENRVPPPQLHEKIREYDLDLSAARYCVAAVRHERSGDTKMATFSLEPFIEQHLQGEGRFMLLRTLDCLLVLFLLGPQSDARDVIARLNTLFLPAKRLLGFPLSIGVGRAYSTLEDAPRSYREALEALDYQVLMEQDQSIYIADVEPDAAEAEMELPSTEELLRCVKLGSREELQQAVDALIAALRNTQLGLQQYQIFNMELSTDLLKLVKTYQLDRPDTLFSAPLLERSNASFTSLAELGHWLGEYCENLRTHIRRERKDSARVLVEQAQALLAERFHESNLSLEAVSSELNVSPAYFSTLFKRETGQSFVSYLTRLRTEKALEYLQTTGDKTYIIAQKVGYEDPNYFSYVFKKQYGISPSKYRAKGMNEHEPAIETP